MGESNVDLELVHRVQKGDKRAFDTLVLKYQQKIANLVSRYMRDSADVQDICQESFIKAYCGSAALENRDLFMQDNFI